MQGRKATLLKLTSTEIIDIKRQIHRRLGIPIRLQLIFHNGKLLTGKSKVDIEPFDNIHISIRGRGGMKKEGIYDYRFKESKESESNKQFK